MVEQHVGVADVRVAWDLAADRWSVERGARAWTVRRWTWGERQRLLTWAAGPRGLDADRFTRGLLDLLVDPPDVDAGDAPALASVVLELHGVLPGAPAAPLERAAIAAARVLGWGPQQLEGQPIPAVDHLLANLGVVNPGPPPPAEPDDGWTRIVVDDD
jgi:hypothetical protein